MSVSECMYSVCVKLHMCGIYGCYVHGVCTCVRYVRGICVYVYKSVTQCVHMLMYGILTYKHALRQT